MNEEKVCSICKEPKPLSRYGYRIGRGTIRTDCKDCTNAYQKKYRLNNLLKMAEHQSDYRKKNKDKAACRNSFRKAIQKGSVVKPPCCDRCGETGTVEGHHHDYLKPFDVKWLCVNCHKREHGKYDPETQRLKKPLAHDGEEV